MIDRRVHGLLPPAPRTQRVEGGTLVDDNAPKIVSDIEPAEFIKEVNAQQLLQYLALVLLE